MTSITQVDKDLWNFVRPTYEVENYTGAILAAVQFVTDILRRKSGLNTDGHTLVGQTLGSDDPLVKINALRTDSEKEEQRGFEFLLRGLYTGIRNPRSHEKRNDKKETADAIIIFVDFIAAAIGKSKSPFDPESIITRVIDPHFVPTQAYVDMLIREIPIGVRLDVLLLLLDKGDWDNIEHVSLFSHRMVDQLLPAEQVLYWSAIAGRLMNAQYDVDFVIGVTLASGHWNKVDQITRARTENRLLNAISSSALGPGAALSSMSIELCVKQILKEFEMKDELIAALRKKALHYNVDERRYFYSYFGEVFAEIYPSPDKAFIQQVNRFLKQQKIEVYFGLSFIDVLPSDSGWHAAFIEQRDKYEFKDDDIPF